MEAPNGSILPYLAPHFTPDSPKSQSRSFASETHNVPLLDSSDSVHEISSPCHSDSQPHEQVPITEIPPRKSSRVRAPPTWLKDYVCPKSSITAPESVIKTNAIINTQPTSLPSSSSSQSHSFHSTSTPYPLFTFLNLAHLSASYMSSLVNVLQQPEPKHYAQAKLYLDWVKAMDHELTASEQNHTWILTSLPQGKKALTSKWVYKTKYKADGSVERHKARLVIRGFEQVKDKDYKHTFSPVAKLTTVRVFIALATAKSWPLHQLDINNAFLHGYLDEEVYMVPPEGYTKAKPGQVCKL